jgi:hypothetical protein
MSVYKKKVANHDRQYNHYFIVSNASLKNLDAFILHKFPLSFFKFPLIHPYACFSQIALLN